MDPYDKFFLDFNGTRPFFQKNFRYVNVFYGNYGKEFQIKAQVLTDTFYKKRTSEKISWFQS